MIWFACGQVRDLSSWHFDRWEELENRSHDRILELKDREERLIKWINGNSLERLNR